MLQMTSVEPFLRRIDVTPPGRRRPPSADVPQTGEVFDRYGSGLIRRFGYNDLSELEMEDSAVSGASLKGRDFDCRDDEAGRR